MADIQPGSACPGCGTANAPGAVACAACGQELQREQIVERPQRDDEARPRRRRRDEYDDYPPERPRRRDIRKDDGAEEALSWIVPMRESLWAIAAGYLGLFSCFPFAGLVAGLLAILCAIMALKDIKRNPGRRGAFRAWFGIVLGGLMIVVWTFMGIFMALSGVK
jgi:hypothetical protein